MKSQEILFVLDYNIVGDYYPKSELCQYAVSIQAKCPKSGEGKRDRRTNSSHHHNG